MGVGRAIGKIAAERIIPLALELGGKSANIVFEDRHALKPRHLACAARGRPDRRGRFLTPLGQIILEHSDALTALEARDTGKPLSQARSDITIAARYFEFYGAAADKVHGDTAPYLAGHFVATEHIPHGVTGHIIPWNYPAQMFGRSLAPALAMGNATVLKPAEDTCLTALRLAELGGRARREAQEVNRRRLPHRRFFFLVFQNGGTSPAMMQP
ncbi:MAG: aldehyde dehydrogenase family protein [Rhodobacteraceae bacterium]|nr:aldehyde dehydrogenase family protein [Paracoccaceae bacterium]